MNLWKEKKPKKKGKEREGLCACGYYTKHPHHGSLWRHNPQYRRRKDRERRDQRDNACNLLFSVKIRAYPGHLIQHINSKNKNTLRETWSNMVSHYTFYIYCGFWRIRNVVVVVFIFLFHCRKVTFIYFFEFLLVVEVFYPLRMYVLSINLTHLNCHLCKK